MKIKLFLSIIVLALFFACGPTTQIVKVWSDPSLNAETVKAYNKVLVIAQMKDDASRRIAEDKIVASSLKNNFIQSYNYFKSSQQEEKLVVANLLNDNIDGIILMRLTNIEKSTSYIPGTAYYGGWGYGGGYYGGYGGWGYGGAYYTDPGHYQEDKTYYVETNFYDVKTNKLLWSGTTSTLNPTQLNESLDSIIMAIRTELNNKGLIKEETKK